MPNPVFEAVRTMLAVREYQDKGVPADLMLRVVEAGRLTGSAMNGQPWHFVLVRERETLREMGAVVSTGRYIAQAAAAVVVGYQKRSLFGVSDCSRAIQSMMLSAWAEGVASNWVGFGHLKGIAEVVGFPDTYEVLAVVSFGYPKRAIKGEKKRKPLAEVASAERFDTPLH
jgi:nitroreductase